MSNWWHFTPNTNQTSLANQGDTDDSKAQEMKLFFERGRRAQMWPLWYASLWGSMTANTQNNNQTDRRKYSMPCLVARQPSQHLSIYPEHKPVWLAVCAAKTSPWEMLMRLCAWVTFRLLRRHLCWHLRGYRRGTAPEPSAADDSLYPLQYAGLVKSHIHTQAHARTQAHRVQRLRIANWHRWL